MSNVTGAHEIIFALQEHGDDVVREVRDELAVVAQLVAQTMRQLAAKGITSTLTNSIKADKVDADTYDVGPHVTYARYVEDGVKPGGKGLPRFFSPDSRSIVQWLQKSAFGGKRKPKLGTRARQSFETQLRDRYQGLAWHIRRHGVKAQPFVEPTAVQMEPVVLSRLEMAVRRAMASRGAAA